MLICSIPDLRNTLYKPDYDKDLLVLILLKFRAYDAHKPAESCEAAVDFTMKPKQLDS